MPGLTCWIWGGPPLERSESVLVKAPPETAFAGHEWL